MPGRRCIWLTAIAAASAAIGVAASAGQAGAATYTVTSVSVSPLNANYPRSLPYAIDAANLNPGHDTIRFNIPGPGAGVHTIRPGSTLEITDPLTIDGYSQPGATPATAAAPAAPKIEIDALGVDHALHITADDSDIRGLVVTGAGSSGILVEGDRNKIVGSHIGTTPDGLTADNNQWGVEIKGHENVIGGTVPDARNLISENLVGVLVTSGSGNLIQGNRIGTDATGSAPLGNGLGVLVQSSGSTVGGADPGEGNLISGNRGEGIELRGDGADGNVVQGNLIGTDASGNSPLGNRDGIDIEGGDDNLIGGPVLGEGNVIADSVWDGIAIGHLDGDHARGNVVQGNLIGVGANGVTPMGNGRFPEVYGTYFGQFPSGVYMLDADDTLIGGTEPRAGNVIAHSGGDGVEVGGGTNNRILGNSIFDNGDREEDLGIDLEADGVTENDPPQDLDADRGANEWQNFPQITSATLQDGLLTVHWTLDSLASTRFRVEFFGNPTCDDSGYGEGARFLHGETVTTNASGHASGSFSTTRWRPFFWFTTGTATISEGALDSGDLIDEHARAADASRTSTSEFSPCFNDIAF